MIINTSNRATITVELPSYPGSQIEFYQDITESQRRQLQRKYSHVMQALVSKSQAGVDLTNQESAMDIVKDVSIADLSEMGVYEWFLKLKSWNLQTDDGQAMALSFENFDELLFDADTAHIRDALSAKDDKKKGKSDLTLPEVKN